MAGDGEGSSALPPSEARPHPIPSPRSWSLSIPSEAIGPFCELEWSLLSRRYKGQHTARHNERECPFWVDVPIPEGGLGRRLDEMLDWHRLHGMVVRMGTGTDRARFCFQVHTHAEGFAEAFAARATPNLSRKLG